MKAMNSHNLLVVAALAAATTFTASTAHAADPLPSWNDGKARQSIIAFIEKVTKAGSPDFVPVPERIAVFDNDGTLWSEQPAPVQFYFVADRVKAVAGASWARASDPNERPISSPESVSSFFIVVLSLLVWVGVG